MKEVSKLENTNLYLELRDIIKIANEAVKEAKDENKHFGIPEYFWKNGKIYYLLDNGKITTEIPEILKRRKTA